MTKETIRKLEPVNVEGERAALLERQKECHAEIQKVLESHGFTIRAILTQPVEVGRTGSQVQIGCTWGIFPA